MGSEKLPAAKRIVDDVKGDVDVELWHTADDQAYISIKKYPSGHVEHHPLRSKKTRQWLAACVVLQVFRKDSKTAPYVMQINPITFALLIPSVVIQSQYKCTSWTSSFTQQYPSSPDPSTSW